MRTYICACVGAYVHHLRLQEPLPLFKSHPHTHDIILHYININMVSGCAMMYLGKLIRDLTVTGIMVNVQGHHNQTQLAQLCYVKCRRRTDFRGFHCACHAWGATVRRVDTTDGDETNNFFVQLVLCGCLSLWVNYNDLTATSLGIMVNKGNHPQMALIQVSEIL